SGVDFWHAVEFSRNGRFLCTHPRGLSSGLSFGLSFGISCFQPYQIRFPFRFRFGVCFWWPVGVAFAFRLVPDFIRSISAELIGFLIRI
ncbi:hypothetical protein, partial [Streptomyces flavidovirens]|uniref:hypothetical protein n=1 Tax=Streptomyces flavidovirens TaxID=67298 RepID=UPI0036C44163